MKVISFTQESKYIDNGLDTINLLNLNDLVILSGKNGSGKTRLLNLIHQGISNSEEKQKSLISAKRTLNHAKDTTRGGTATGAFSVKVNPQEVAHLENEISKIQTEIERKYNYKINYNDDEKRSIKTFNIFPNGDEISKKPNTSSIDELKSTFQNAKKMTDLEHIYEYHELILYYIYNEYIKCKSAEYNNNMCSEISECFLEINRYFTKFLETEYTIKDDQIIFFSNQPIEKLSPGQKLIIRFSILMVFYKPLIKNSIFFIDEPENHLHPYIAIEMINELKSICGQIWIATHNISILSYFQSYSILFIDNSKIRIDGKIKTDVINSLLGTDTTHLISFLEKPFRQGLLDFYFQCLFVPESKSLAKKDVQVLQTNHVIKSLQSKIGEPLKVLDYGAGECNILNYLKSDFDNETILKTIDYFAYDTSVSKKDQGINILYDIYGNSKERYFTRKENIEIKFDLIIFANLLHEISPRNWELEFNYIHDHLLKDNGAILIIENTEIKTGEKAHEFGFIVLESKSLNLLFNHIHDGSDLINLSEELHTIYEIDPIILKRVQAHLIKKKIVQNITKKSICSSLVETKKRAKEEIKKIHSLEPSRLNGKLIAFYTQQYTSSDMALGYFKDNNEQSI